MQELKKHEQDFLNELIQHPGWNVFVRVLEYNKALLIDALYTCPIDTQQDLIQRWRALETLYRECKSLETTQDVVQLGVD